MASPFQQRIRFRKAIYAGLILVLFTGSYFLRDRVILAQAEDLGLREETRGEVKLSDSAIRLSLTGSRGLAVCMLWLKVQETQRRHEWSEMDTYVRLVAKLQPHFIMPWLFQSWNMSFNVPAECDSPYDKYFYIARGIQLLAEGERRNQGIKKGNIEVPGNPDLRFHLGFYYQHKIGKADENRTLRSFYQMSCLRESERDPDKLEPKDENGRPRLNRAKFREFCERNPRLVRRLREQLGCATPEDVVSFLRRHRNLPGRYARSSGDSQPDDKEPLKENALERFPLLPPQGVDKYFDNDDGRGSNLEDDFDDFVASRHWYRYAMKPLPPPDPNINAFGLEWDKKKYRMPKMTHYIFRQYPGLAEINIAEHLGGGVMGREGEGWFDHRGWVIEDKLWFSHDGPGGRKIADRIVVGQSDRYSSQTAWKRALDAFQDYGTRTQFRMVDEWDEWMTGLMRNTGGALAAGAGDPAAVLTRVRRIREPGALTARYMKLLQQSTTARERFGKQTPSKANGGPSKDRSQASEEGSRADKIMFMLHHYRALTSYRNHYYRSEAEATDEAVSARLHYYNAKEIDEKTGDKQRSVKELQKWMSEWKLLLEHKPGFRDCDDIQEETYHRQLIYFDRFQRQDGGMRDLFLKAAALVPPTRVPLPFIPDIWLKTTFADPRDPDRPRGEEWQREQLARIIPAFTTLGSKGPFSPRGPFDGLYYDGTAFIPEWVLLPLREKRMKMSLQMQPKPVTPAGEQSGGTGPAEPRGEKP
jgi:hypothetical protein